MTTTITQPSAYLVICGSAVAYDDRGEILETVEFLPDGKPDWTNAGGCDHRGGGGLEGFKALARALDAAELNARLLLDGPPVRVPSESVQ